MRIAKLGEIAFINPEKDVQKVQAVRLVSFVPMASVSEETCTIRYQEEREIGEVIKGYTSFNKGDILLAKITPCFQNGKIAIAEIDHEIGFGSTEFHVVRPDIHKLDSRYLFYFLRQKSFLEEGEKRMTGSAGQKRIPAAFLRDLRISLPPLEEQRRIAAVLDKADRLRQLDRQLIAKYDQLTQSAFLDMFGDPGRNEKGWKTRKVIEACNCIVPGRDKPKSFTGEIPWITTDDLRHLGVTKNSKKALALNLEEIDEVGAKVIPQGSVLMTCVGDLGVVSIAAEPIVINQQLHSFQCGKAINNFFLMHNLSFQKPYMIKMASSTTIPYMNKTVCNSIPILLPPLELQNQFADIVQNIESQKAKAEASLQKSEALFNALLQRAFRGELFAEVAEREAAVTAEPEAAGAAQLKLF